MLKKPDAKQPEDEITQKLRAAARKRRPVTWQALLMLLAVFLVPAGLFLWWVLHPRPDPPRLDVVAFDQLGLTGKEIDLRAFLEPLDVDPAKVDLGGYQVFFEENMLPGKAKAGDVKETTSLLEGMASVSWSFDGVRNSFVVRIPGDQQRRGAMDRGQVFLWPKDTPILLVDVQATLSSAKAGEWQKKNPLEIKPLAEAAKALQTALQKKFQVVYLALAADRPLAYRKVRGWVENQVNGKNPFPAGPVLGRTTYVADGESAARQEILRGLKESFRGPLLAVVGQGEAAAVCRGIGVDTILFGADAAPEDVVRIKSWAEVPEKMPKK